MAQLYIDLDLDLDLDLDPSEWAATPLDGAFFTLTATASGLIHVRPATGEASDTVADAANGAVNGARKGTVDDDVADVQLVRSRIDDADAETWVLLSGSGNMLVNGERSAGTCRVLRDQDEIRLPGAKACFLSLAQSAVVVPFPESDHVATCPRCTCPLTPGRPSVRCSCCGIYHHEVSPDQERHEEHQEKHQEAHEADETTAASDASDFEDLPCWSDYEDVGCANCHGYASLDGSDLWSPAEL